MHTGRRHFLTLAMGTGLGLATAAAVPASFVWAEPIGDKDMGPNEDLMREHGVLHRILLVYEEAIRRIRAGESLPVESLGQAASAVQQFVEGYHEIMEENYVFPKLKEANKLPDIVDILIQQHQAGRELTAAIVAGATPDAFKDSGKQREVADKAAQFIRMYRPHAAWEDTVVFLALRTVLSRQQYDDMGETFEKEEKKLVGPMAFERAVETVAGIEKAFGIHDLAAFTTKS